MGKAKSGFYTVEIEAFAPWGAFGTPLTNIAGPYRGDNRLFSVNGECTARIHFSAQVNLATGEVVNVKTWSDASHGPWGFIGPQGEATSEPKVQVRVSTSREVGTQFVISLAGGLPLVPAPDIDFQVAITLLRTPSQLEVRSEITGDGFPAAQVVLRDPAGTGLFVGGYSANSRDEITKLFGEGHERLADTALTLSTDKGGTFKQVLSADFTTRDSSVPDQSIRDEKAQWVDQWNQQILGALNAKFEAAQDPGGEGGCRDILPLQFTPIVVPGIYGSLLEGLSGQHQAAGAAIELPPFDNQPPPWDASNLNQLANNNADANEDSAIQSLADIGLDDIGNWDGPDVQSVCGNNQDLGDLGGGTAFAGEYMSCSGDFAGGTDTSAISDAMQFADLGLSADAGFGADVGGDSIGYAPTGGDDGGT